jgi:hypothetical protein
VQIGVPAWALPTCGPVRGPVLRTRRGRATQVNGSRGGSGEWGSRGTHLIPYSSYPRSPPTRYATQGRIGTARLAPHRSNRQLRAHASVAPARKCKRRAHEWSGPREASLRRRRIGPGTRTRSVVCEGRLKRACGRASRRVGPARSLRSLRGSGRGGVSASKRRRKEARTHARTHLVIRDKREAARRGCTENGNGIDGCTCPHLDRVGQGGGMEMKCVHTYARCSVSSV